MGSQRQPPRIYTEIGDFARASAYVKQRDPTMQGHGSLLRARELAWLNPIAGVQVVLPAPPAPQPFVAGPASAAASPRIDPRRGPNAGN